MLIYFNRMIRYSNRAILFETPCISEFCRHPLLMGLICEVAPRCVHFFVPPSSVFWQPPSIYTRGTHNRWKIPFISTSHLSRVWGVFFLLLVSLATRRLLSLTYSVLFITSEGKDTTCHGNKLRGRSKERDYFCV